MFHVSSSLVLCRGKNKVVVVVVVGAATNNELPDFIPTCDNFCEKLNSELNVSQVISIPLCMPISLGRYSRKSYTRRLYLKIQTLTLFIYHFDRNGNPKVLFHVPSIQNGSPFTYLHCTVETLSLFIRSV